ncbi:MAG: DegT/DnrJ/EryC1/StrS family aminotransferase [Terracidiphilus sp.]|nr:DegT/DnrJ/EryC1/StrS family aminotransferase [Terracidiphilus sp.]
MLAKYTGAKQAVAAVNGTAALFIALKLAGVEAGDEVLVSTLTFVATANVVAYWGATPHFVDSEYSPSGMDPAKLDHYLCDIAVVDSNGAHYRQTGTRIKAVVPMHTFGHPVYLDAVINFARTS